MKKRIVLGLLTALLVMAAVPVLAATPAEVVGDWYLQYRTRYSDTAMLPLKSYALTLNRDKSAVLTQGETVIDCTWEITSSGDVKLSWTSESGGSDYVRLSLEEGFLLGNYKDYSEEGGPYYDFVFGREEIQLELPAAVLAEKEDDFYGNWRVLICVEEGSAYLSDELFANISVDIEFAQVTVVDADGETHIAMTNYVDGKLVADARDTGIMNKDGSVVLELTDEPGVVLLTLEGVDPMVMSVYMTNNAEEAVPAVEEAPEAETEAVEIAEEAVEEEEAEEMPAPIVAESEEAFYGTWIGALEVNNGEALDITEQGITGVVEFAQITLTVNGTEHVAMTEFVDGTLRLAAKDTGLLPASSPVVYVIELTEDPEVARLTVAGMAPENFCAYAVKVE